MSEIHGAVGSYVVNALDPDELEEFEAHLAVCPTCSREVREFGETAAELALLASAPPPPAALRGSILSAISEIRPLPRSLPRLHPRKQPALWRSRPSPGVRSMSWRCVGSGGVPESSASWWPR